MNMNTNWNELSTGQKILTVLGLISGVLFFILLPLSTFGIWDNTVIVRSGLMFVHCLCRTFTEKSKVLKIFWAILAVFSCVSFLAFCFMAFRYSHWF